MYINNNISVDIQDIRQLCPFCCSAAKTGWTLWPSQWWTCGPGSGCGSPRAGTRMATTLRSRCTTRAGRWTSPPRIETGTSMPCWRDWQWRPGLTGSTTSPKPTSTAASSQVREDKCWNLHFCWVQITKKLYKFFVKVKVLQRTSRHPGLPIKVKASVCFSHPCLLVKVKASVCSRTQNGLTQTRS